jgi:hypothetical protein
MLPEFDENGNLPPGEHRATLEEVIKRFNVHSWRTRGPLTQALQDYVNQIPKNGISRVYVDGSYTTAKLSPADIDLTLVFFNEYDLDTEAWRFRNQTWRKRKLDIHLYRENDIGLERHLQGWNTDLERQIPKGIVLLEL